MCLCRGTCVYVGVHVGAVENLLCHSLDTMYPFLMAPDPIILENVLGNLYSARTIKMLPHLASFLTWTLGIKLRSSYFQGKHFTD